MPQNISFIYNVGFLLLVTVLLLIVSGLLSVIIFFPNLYSFNYLLLSSQNSFFYIILRVTHNTLASVLFIFLFTHMIKASFFSSFQNNLTFLTGILIFFIFCLVAFLGYVLPMGQMSY